jgi:hypothetical protein
MARRKRHPIWRTIRKVRRGLHYTERTLGDLDAAGRGVLHKRIARRWFMRWVGRRINRI